MRLPHAQPTAPIPLRIPPAIASTPTRATPPAVHRVIRLALALIVLAIPATANAASRYKDVIHECAETGQIANPLAYSRNDYQQALAHLPTDVAEYTDCYSIISRARDARAIASASGGGNGSGGNGSNSTPIGSIGGSAGPPPAPANASEQAAVDSARRGLTRPGLTSSSRIAPLLRIQPASLRHDVPTPLIVMLALIAAGALIASLRGLARQLRILGPGVIGRLRRS